MHADAWWEMLYDTVSHQRANTRACAINLRTVRDIAEVQARLGKDAWLLVLEADDAELVALLLEGYRPPHALSAQGQSLSDLLYMARSAAVVDVLVAAGADPHAVSQQNGDTLLHTNCFAPALGRLAELAQDINAVDHLGNTALHTHAIYGARARVEVLLAHGADPSRRNHAGYAALDYAQRCAEAMPASIPSEIRDDAVETVRLLRTAVGLREREASLAAQPAVLSARRMPHP